MDIPFYKKENPNDCSCAPVCLRMALAYFGINNDIYEVYKLCESLGTIHYTLPWGMCLGASKVGLNSIFISKKPFELLQTSYENISTKTGISTSEISQIVLNQIKRCKENVSVFTLEWKQEFKELPKKIIQESIEAVIIPTLWWGNQPHNIVIVNYMDPGIELGWINGPEGFKSVYYHDPNVKDTLPTMPEDVFFEKWLHPYTDNDILIISNQKLDLNDLLFST